MGWSGQSVRQEQPERVGRPSECSLCREPEGWVVGGRCEGFIHSAVLVHLDGKCKVRAEVPWERVPKRGKVGQRGTSECSWEPGKHGTEGLASAWRLRPHGMPMLYFRWTRLGQGPARTRENRDSRY